MYGDYKDYCVSKLKLAFPLLLKWVHISLRAVFAKFLVLYFQDRKRAAL